MPVFCRFLPIVLLTFSLSAVMAQSSADTVELRQVFGEYDGCFVLLDVSTGHLVVHNPGKAHRRFIPASTFKIPHTLIILESGLAADAEFFLAWDSVKVPARDWWPEAWSHDQTLRSAFRNSVVWFYQETARRIGEHQMRAYLQAFDYGNQDMSGGIDRFWLSGGLRISPVEQVVFLRKLYQGNFRITPSTRATLLEVMLLEESNGIMLRGKTGTGTSDTGTSLAWLVGFVEKSDAVYAYALLLEGETVAKDWPPARRRELVQECLRELHISE